MQEKFLNHACCPECNGALRLTAFQWDKEYFEDIIEGSLVCQQCGMAYPIINGIPRMLKTSFLDHPDFVEKYGDQLKRQEISKNQESALSRYKKTFMPTADSFGFEWRRYKVTPREEDIVTFFGLTGVDPRFCENHDADNIFIYYPTKGDLAGIDASFLQSKLVLDVGCGMGKYTDLVSDYGAEVVGLDLSVALLRAREKTRRKRNVHLVQGNIFSPPIRKGTFDFGFSLGVLHHTPSTEAAFKNMASLIRPGGAMSIWVYPSALTGYDTLNRFIQDDVLKPILRRMPHLMLYQICRVLGAMVLLRGRLASSNLPGHQTLEKLIGLFAVGMHKDSEIASFLNFDWYSPQFRFYHSEEEVYAWFEEAGFKDIRILRQRVSATGTKKSRIDFGSAHLLDFECSRKKALVGGESLDLSLQWHSESERIGEKQKVVAFVRSGDTEYSMGDSFPSGDRLQKLSIQIPQDAPTGIYHFGIRLGPEDGRLLNSAATNEDKRSRTLGEIEIVNRKEIEEALRNASCASVEGLKPVAVNFENRVLLKGVGWSGPTAPAGGFWGVSLAWRTLVRLDDRLSTGICFHDSSGKPAFSFLQYSGCADGLYFHKPGASFVEEINVSIPKDTKPGRYKALLGLRFRNYKEKDDRIGLPALYCLDDSRQTKEYFELCEIAIL